MLRHVSLEERPIVVLGLRGRLLGATPIPHRSYIPYRDLYRDIRQKTSREYTNYLLSAEDRYRDIGHDRGQEAEQKQVEIIPYMDYDASFHATYCKEELGRFKLCSGKVHLTDDKTLDIASVGDVILKTSFGSLVVAHGNKHGSLYMVEVHPEGIGVIINGSGSAVVWFGEAEEYFFYNVSEDKETVETAAGVANGIVMLKMVPETPLQFGVAERLSRTFRAESTGIRAEAPKMLWADSVSTTYLIYRIPYVPIGLRIPEEEWRGKDTSLAHLKVFGCDSFVKVKDVCGEAMKCTFIGSGSDEMRYSFRDTKSHQVIQSRDITFMDSIYGARSATDSSSLTKPIQKSQVVLVDIPKNLAENGRYCRDGLCLEITQSPENGEPKSYSEALSSKESVQWKNAIIEEMVKEEQNSSEKEPSYVGALNDTSTHHKSEGFQLAGQEENLECRLKEIMYGLIQARGFKHGEFNSLSGCGITTVEYTKSLIHRAKNLKVCSWAKLVRILISEGSLSLSKILVTKSLAAMFTGWVMKEKLKFCATSTSL
ncbi:retrovirus-related pol polyprotein from transposon TNT 1-94 [Tanacetum coccineum]